MKLSSLTEVDLSSLRAESMTRARAAVRSGKIRPVTIAVYTDARKPVLEDGRHRIAAAMREGVRELPAIVRKYGPRGGLRSWNVVTLKLDEWP